MSIYAEFLYAISHKRIVEITFDSNEKGIITRQCVPFDFGPSRIYRDGLDRYHFYTLNSPEGSHNLSILPEQLINLKILKECFKPGEYITWKTNWFISRDWGIYS